MQVLKHQNQTRFLPPTNSHLVCVLVCPVEVLQVAEQHLNGADLLAKLLVYLKRLLKQTELNRLGGVWLMLFFVGVGVDVWREVTRCVTDTVQQGEKRERE